MACNIVISSVVGRRTANSAVPFAVQVKGTAEDCSQVRVHVVCAGSSVAGPTNSAIVDVAADGHWSVEFGNVELLCTCGGQIVVRAICVGNPNCSQSHVGSLDCLVADDCPKVDAIQSIIPGVPNNQCISTPVQVMVTLTATGTPGAGNYNWDFGDGSPIQTVANNPSVQHEFAFPKSYSVQLLYKPSTEGCIAQPATLVLNVPDCGDLPPPPDDPPGEKPVVPPGQVPPKDPPGEEPDKPDGPKTPPGTPGGGGGGGFGGCDGLLWAAVGLIFGGSLALGISLCGNLPIGVAISAAALALGLVLFFIWLAVCGSFTKCGVMRSVHCFLFWYITVAVPVAMLVQIIAWLTGGGSWACVAGLFGHLGIIGWLYTQVGKAMTDNNCRKTCG